MRIASAVASGFVRGRAAGLLLVLLAVASGVEAGESPRDAQSVAEAATRLLEAVRASNEARLEAQLRSLTSPDALDPWLVADELCARREHEAARMLARRVPAPTSSRLRAYVDGRAEAPADDSGARRVVAKWEREVLEPLLKGAYVPPEKGRFALAALAGLAPRLSEVARLRAAHVQGLAKFILVRRDEAEETLVAAAEAAERLGWLRLAGRLWTLGARVPLMQADYDTAETRLEQSRKQCLAAGDEGCEADALGDLASIRAARGEHQDALPLLRRAVEVKRKLGRRGGLVASLVQLGNVLHMVGDFTGALSCFDEARRLSEELHNPVWIGVALANMANVYGDAGNNERAKQVYDEVLERFRVAREKEAEAYTVGNLGSTCLALGRYAEAAECFQAALDLCGEFCDPMFAARTHLGLGNLHLEMGEVDTAIAHFREARAEGKTVCGEPFEATVMHRLGCAHEAGGRPETAIAFHDWALKAGERHALPEVQVTAMCGRARAELALGRVLDAVESASRAVARARGLYRGLAEEESAGARGKLARDFEVGVRAAVEARDTVLACFFLESGRANALLETLLARDSIRRARIPPTLLEEEAAAQRAVAEARKAERLSAVQGLIRDLRKRRTALDEAEARLTRALEQIQRHVRSAADVLYPSADHVDVIRDRLEPDEALVLYGLLRDRALALVIEPGGTRVVPLGTAEGVRQACNRLFLDEAPWIDEGQVSNLRSLVADPLWLAPGTKRVLVSPAGVLAYVPFALLLPGYEVACVPSGTTYGVLLDDASCCGEDVLAVGDPDYGTPLHPHARDLYRGGNRGVLHALPGTRAEAEAVGDVVLLGRDATEGRLRAVIGTKRWRAVHLACHGLVDPDRPTLSSLALTPTEEDDGFLAALEVFRMKILADLVVLSACETAKGRIYEAEGIVGLTRAFMFAGSPRVLCSLWKVDDDATRALMTKFYELWHPRASPADPERPKGAEGAAPGALGAAAALREAQRFVRGHAKWRHPTYWAAWVLWGVPQ